jgi:hypothetical protein
MGISPGRIALFINLIVSLLIAIPSSSFFGEIVVQQGKCDHFDIRAPQKLSTGEKVAAEITAVYAFNDVITAQDREPQIDQIQDVEK